MGLQLPKSVTWAVRTQTALVAVSGLLTVLTAVQREELEAAFVARESPDIDVPAFVPVAVVLWATFALLAAVLVVFFRAGHPSARLSLTGLAAFFLFAMVVMYQQDPPGLFDRPGRGRGRARHRPHLLPVAARHQRVPARRPARRGPGALAVLASPRHRPSVAPASPQRRPNRRGRHSCTTPTAGLDALSATRCSVVRVRTYVRSGPAETTSTPVSAGRPA